jgi:glucose uptake protein GlcU
MNPQVGDDDGQVGQCPRTASCPEISVEYGAINDTLIRVEKMQAKYDWPIAGFVFVVDVLIVIAIFMLNRSAAPSEGIDPTSAVGWVATLGAVFIFGTFGVLIKTKAVQDAAVHSLVFQLYYAAGVVTACISLWAISREPLCISPWGGAFAVCWIGSQFFAYSAISSIGYAVGPAVWGGVTIVVSFTWGCFVFEDPVQSIVGSAFALLVLVLGICLAASTQSSFPKALAEWCTAAYGSCQRKAGPKAKAKAGRIRSLSTPAEIGLSSSQSSPSLNRSLIQSPGGSPSKRYAGDKRTDVALLVLTADGRRHVIRGTIAAMLSGLFNGSMTVGLRCFPDKCPAMGVLNQAWGQCDGLSSPPMAFLPSCAVACGVMVPLFFIAFFGMANVTTLNYRFADVAVPGFLTGCFWAMGNFAAFFSTMHLGMTIGYPLTQTCIIVSGLWGIFYYKEIRGRPAIGLFFVSTAVILIGAGLDGLFG